MKKIYEIKKINIEEHSEYSNTVMIDKSTLTKNVRLHWHNYYEIEYITDGRCTEIINGHLAELYPGVMRILSPSDFHELIITEPISLIKICFDISDVSPEAFRIVSNLNIQTLLPDGENKLLLDGLFTAAIRQKNLLDKEYTYPLIAKRILETILLTAAGCIHSASSVSDGINTLKEVGINSVLSYIQSNFTEGITLKEVAEKNHFSPSYLSRYFHKVMGMTFLQYIKNLRMDMAAKLLVSTDYDITEICYEVGISSLSTFSKEFKERYRLSPTEYRKKGLSH